MAIIGLKDTLKCLGLTSEKNFSLSKVFSGLVTGIMKAAGAAITQITGAFDAQIQSVKDSFNAARQQGIDAYNQAKSLLDNIPNPFSGIFEISCKESKDAKVQEPSVNTVNKTFSMPRSNDDTINTVSEDIKNKVELDAGATIGLPAIANAIDKINASMNNKGPSEIREYVRQLKDLHPNLLPYISNLQYFQPVSEYIGSSIIAYTPDKPSLLLEQWKNQTIGALSTPTAIRKNLKGKIRPEVFNAVEQAYVGLNIKFQGNVPNEFSLERTMGGFNTSHSYHLAGDYTFNVDHMNPNEKTQVAYKVAVAFNEALGNQIKQIDYYYPISENITIENDVYTTEEEPNTPIVKMDRRKNLAIPPFTKVNNDALHPTIPEES